MFPRLKSHQRRYLYRHYCCPYPRRIQRYHRRLRVRTCIFTLAILNISRAFDVRVRFIDLRVLR